MTRSRIFEAQHPGVCPDCEQKISPGDRVNFDDYDLLVHDACPPHRHGAICPGCHTTRSLAGECLCPGSGA